MRYLDEERKPSVLGGSSLAIALGIHVVFGLLLWGLGEFEFKSKEVVIPIELTVVMPPNPDGDKAVKPKKEDVLPPEPPKPKPTPPKPKVEPPKPKVEPPKPKLEEVVKQEVVEQVKAKTNRVAKIEKKKDDKPPEKKKTAKELQAERIAEMRARAKKVDNKNPNQRKNSNPSNAWTPPTDKPITQLEKIPDYFKAGTEERLTSSEEQRCLSYIKMAYYNVWSRPSYSASLRIAELEVEFDMNGRVLGKRLVKSFGSKAADDSVLSAAARVTRVNGLTSAFLKKSGMRAIVKFEVTPE